MIKHEIKAQHEIKLVRYDQIKKDKFNYNQQSVILFRAKSENRIIKGYIQLKYTKIIRIY